MADHRRIDGAGSMTRQELIFALLEDGADDGDTLRAEGIVEVLPDGFGFLRGVDNDFSPGADDIYVSPSQIRRFNLRTGDSVGGVIRPPKENERYFALLRVEQVNDGDPEGGESAILFDNLTPVYPSSAFAVGIPAIDRWCPIGRGQRCLIVAPPRAGASELAHAIAGAVASHASVIALLIGERPEDVTAVHEQLAGEVIATTFDEPPGRHVQVAEIVFERAKRKAERGGDVVVLVDSISRLARAYAAADPAAPHRFKRLLASARALAEGGSLALVGTVARDTGDPIDDAILRELADVANCELHLSRALADEGASPALDLHRSFTRRADRLLDDAARERAAKLRARLPSLSGADALRAIAE